jgi:protein-S-isoprenylcysteine O-methyltransferase Ste14
MFSCAQAVSNKAAAAADCRTLSRRPSFPPSRLPMTGCRMREARRNYVVVPQWSRPRRHSDSGRCDPRSDVDLGALETAVGTLSAMALSRQALAFTVIPLVVIPAAMVELRPAHWDVMRMTGLILTTVGFALLTVARVQLGNSFSVTPQARALVTTGVYSRIRNPVYVFGAIGIAGFALYVGNPRLLALFLVLIPVQILRARAEGRKLEGKFGEQYREWRRQTWF